MIEKEYTVVFSGNGENPCLAVNEEAYDKIYADELLHDNYAKRMKELRYDNYHRLKDGTRLWDIEVYKMFDWLPKESPDLKGYKLKMSFEPLTAEDVEEGWFE
jgi:hypothetical protein